MYSWSKDWPTLTEIFFGKGNGPQGPLNGKTKEAPKEKEATAKKSAPKTKSRGTRKDFGLQKKLKELK
jgi:hypothetical protein|tara:strand:+ start:119 stop:322 length:204 start_codon:yes stop_codon:yes gene_type:complete